MPALPALLAEAPLSDDTISVLIVAKDPISHAGVERQLLAMSDFTVLPRTTHRHPDVALVVADSVTEEVLDWIRTIRKVSLSRIVVVAAVSAQAEEWAKDAGANGVVPRSMADGPRLAWAIQKAHRGDPVMMGGTAERTDPPVAPLGRPKERDCQVVSDRDREVLRLLADGCDTGEIARTLAYSEPTIKNVIQRLFEQLKAKNRPHAVALALRDGIIL